MRAFPAFAVCRRYVFLSRLCRAGALSAQIEELKAQSMAFCNSYMQQHDMNMEEGAAWGGGKRGEEGQWVVRG